MLIGVDGPVNEIQQKLQEEIRAQEAREQKERDRLKKLSNGAIEREIREVQRTTGKTNALCFATCLGLISFLHADLRGSHDPRRLGVGLAAGNDPYLRTYPKRGKTTRRREVQASAVK